MTLDRKFVGGSGSNGGPPTTEYTFGFQNNEDDYSTDGRTLLIDTANGHATVIALGPKGSRSFYAPDAGDDLLTVVDGGATEGFTVKDLPYVVKYVADVSNGNAIVVTQAMEPWSGTDERIFYGKPSQMVEYPLLSDDVDCCETYIGFTVNGAMYTAHLVFAPDPGTIDGPSTLETGTTMLNVNLRTPTPSSLVGFSFVCSKS